MTYCRDRLFKAVQETLPDSEKIKRIESKEDVARAVQQLLNHDQQQPRRQKK